MSRRHKGTGGPSGEVVRFYVDKTHHELTIEGNTIAEYRTKGMLLDMHYYPECHAFAGGDTLQNYWLDADTLEPITRLERHRRRLAFLDKHKDAHS